MKKTKIVATVGPSTDAEGLLEKLITAGVDVARFNFSHGTQGSQGVRIKQVRAAAKAAGKEVALMADTKGPEVRLGMFADDQVLLEEGASFTLTTVEMAGTAQMATVRYEGLPQDVEVGNHILLDDGKLTLEVTAIGTNTIDTKVIHGGMVSSRKRVAVPGCSLHIPFFSEQDKSDLTFAAQQGMDYVAASFVQKPEDVLAIRKHLESLGSSMQIIAKIESRDGVNNLEDILKVADGIMVARGDLGVEIPAEEVPLVQKQIIAICNTAGKPVITATQMLESMINSYRATRAEACDVANSIFDGTDAIMLSGETASGKYPLEAVQTMATIAQRTEEALDYVKIFQEKGLRNQVNTTDAVSHATVQIAEELDADAILTLTESGYTARMIAKYRPQSLVIGVSPEEDKLRRMQMYWGVKPLLGLKLENTDELIEKSIQSAQEAGLVHEGDLVVVTAGVPIGQVGSTNLIKVINVGTKILTGTGIGKSAVTGKVCIINSANDLKKLTSDSIMVITDMENEMAPYAARCAGIVAEEGGFTSIAAIVGINCGVPTIVGAHRATAKLRNNQEVTMDVAAGAIYEGIINVK